MNRLISVLVGPCEHSTIGRLRVDRILIDSFLMLVLWAVVSKQ